MRGVSLAALRSAVDRAPALDAPAFARAARNALAQAVLAEAITHTEDPPPSHEPPLDAVRARVGDELAAHLAAVYAGGDGWTTHAIDALEPLHALTRA
jgi:hypothetical protein